MQEKNIKKSIDKFNLKEVICLLIIVSFVSIITGFAIANRVLKDKYNNKEINENSKLQSFIDNYNYIVDNYYGDVDENSLLDSALAAILESLGDPYTVYIGEDEVDNFNIKLEGTYQGLGVEVFINNDGKLEILSVFEDSPAKKSGIKVGDIITKLNGEAVSDSRVFVEKVRNNSNGSFLLTIERGEDTLEILVSTEIINLNSVVKNIFEKETKKIGYIGISIFANNTYAQVKDALEELECQGIDSLIIDVRSNTGGHLTSVENILGLFLDNSHVIYNIKDESGTKAVYSDGNRTVQYPIVILTNELSASASEILTAALKEELGAKSVGEKTYGKGSAQELRTLPDGTQYKITTKKWLTPNGNSIDSVGVDVDVNVKLDSGYYVNPSNENDNQLQKAIEVILGE